MVIYHLPFGHLPFGYLLSDDYKRIVTIYFDDRAGFMGRFVVSAEAAYIIRFIQYRGVYLMKEMGGRMSADVRGGGDDGSFEACAERFAERLIRDPYAYRAVFRHEVRRQVPCIRINDRQRLGFILILPPLSG